MKYFIIVIFFSLNLYSQDIDYLKSQDTLYLLLEESDADLVLKQDSFTYRVYGNNFEHQYFFTNPDKRIIFFSTFNSDQIPGKSNMIVKRRKFFKKNNDKIIDLKFITKHGLNVAFIDILRGTKRKIVYVVNSKEIKKRKITLKRTFIVDGSFTGD